LVITGDTCLSGNVHSHWTEAVQWNVAHSCRPNYSSYGVWACPHSQVFRWVTGESY